MDRIEELLLRYREEMVETLQQWVRIPSVKGEAAPRCSLWAACPSGVGYRHGGLPAYGPENGDF